MARLTLYYATNRRHRGRDRWHPTGYGTDFSRDGLENLRFGVVHLEADRGRIRRELERPAAGGRGDGEGLAAYLSRRAASRRHTRIHAFEERLDPAASDVNQPPEARWGSQALFAELRRQMLRQTDVVVYIHGFNVAWNEAVGSALALQEMLNLPAPGAEPQGVLVVLFTWPSDGRALPFVSYKSDRSEAAASGKAVGRGFLKLRDYLARLRAEARRGGAGPCDRSLHLLCHSMGNYVLQHALARLAEFAPGRTLPRLFDQVFLCAADVDDDCLEPGRPMGRLPEIARGVSVYYNRGDQALTISDVTKGNPDRLGHNGAARPSLLHAKIQQVDCTPVVHGLVEHSYYLSGRVNEDLRMSLAALEPDDPHRRRRRGSLPHTWTLE